MTEDPRSRRRRVALLHHPDRGGDPAAFIAAMRALDDAGPRPVERPADLPSDTTTGTTPTTGYSTASSRAARRVRTTSSGLLRDLRQHLPRSFPGSRRYGRL